MTWMTDRWAHRWCMKTRPATMTTNAVNGRSSSNLRPQCVFRIASGRLLTAHGSQREAEDFHVPGLRSNLFRSLCPVLPVPEA